MYEYVYCRLSRKDRSFQISLNLSRELDLTAIYLVVVYNCRKLNKRLCMARGTLRQRHLYMYRLTVIIIRLWGTDGAFVSREPNRKLMSRKIEIYVILIKHSFEIKDKLLHKNAVPKQMVDGFDFCLTKGTQLTLCFTNFEKKLVCYYNVMVNTEL